MFTEAELLYFAGLFDGEGCIYISVSKTPQTKARFVSRNYNLRLTVSMTYKPVIDWLFVTFGGWAGTTGGKKKPNHKPQWKWQILSNKAASLLNEALPYLKVKHNEALVALEFQSLINKQSNGRGKRGNPLTKEQIQEREILRQQLNSLR